MRDEYEKTKNEIDLFFYYLEISSQPSNLILEDTDSNFELLKILKSNALMMLYNLVEATVRSCIVQYYDKYNELGKTYQESRIEIKKLWLNYNSKFGANTFNTDLFNLIDQTTGSNSLILDIEQFNLSGNADLQKIKCILEDHHIIYNHELISNYGSTMLSVKNSRNYLAHGNLSFTEASKNLTVDDIVGKYKDDVYGCLDYVVGIVEEEIENFY